MSVVFNIVDGLRQILAGLGSVLFFLVLIVALAVVVVTEAGPALGLFEADAVPVLSGLDLATLPLLPLTALGLGECILSAREWLVGVTGFPFGMEDGAGAALIATYGLLAVSWLLLTREVRRSSGGALGALIGLLYTAALLALPLAVATLAHPA
ncbi:MAG: hypothetical protein HXY25_00325 [Alphaproteobacteria bacterium]|nr:hypothetical protein [Alphaproteobacteria bacterium]